MSFFKNYSIPNIQFLNLFALERNEIRRDCIAISTDCLYRRFHNILQEQFLHFPGVQHQPVSIKAGTHGPCRRNGVEIEVVYELDPNVFITQPDFIGRNLTISCEGGQTDRNRGGDKRWWQFHPWP